MEKFFIKDRLKSVRKEQGKTQKEIAIFLNVVESCYANWEQGRTEPNIEYLRKLCIFFNVSADYLLGLSDY